MDDDCFVFHRFLKNASKVIEKHFVGAICLIDHWMLVLVKNYLNFTLIASLTTYDILYTLIFLQIEVLPLVEF